MQGRLDVEAQCRGFLDLAKLAMSCLLNIIFNEPAVASLFGALPGLTPRALAVSVDSPYVI